MRLLQSLDFYIRSCGGNTGERTCKRHSWEVYSLDVGRERAKEKEQEHLRATCKQVFPQPRLEAPKGFRVKPDLAQAESVRERVLGRDSSGLLLSRMSVPGSCWRWGPLALVQVCGRPLNHLVLLGCPAVLCVHERPVTTWDFQPHVLIPPIGPQDCRQTYAVFFFFFLLLFCSPNQTAHNLESSFPVEVLPTLQGSNLPWCLV